MIIQHGGLEEGVCTTDGGCQAALDTASEEKSKSFCAIYEVLYIVKLCRVLTHK